MTQTEKRYSLVLEAMRLAGEIQEWAFECERLILGANLQYTPDFRIINSDQSVEFIEVKPANWEKIPNQTGSTVKIKIAAQMHPYLFSRAVERSRRDGGGFEKTAVDPR